MILYLIYISLILIFISLFIIVRKNNKQWRNLNNFLTTVSSTIHSIRYGNLAAKITNPKYSSLADSINRMIETLSDREKMISEYQSELTKQNKFLEAVINSLSDGILIIDDKHKILRVTPKISEWFNINDSKILKKDIYEFINPIKNTKFEKFNNTEIYIKNSSACFEATTKLLALDEKKRYVIIIKDITSQKEIEKIKEDFVATLTHDLKVPIIAERNILEFLINEKFGSINNEQKIAITNMKNCNDELLELVQTLLDTYKINDSGIELNKKEVDFGNFTQEIVEEMRPIAEKNELEIRCNTQNTQILIDPIQFKRVIKNLILNAISHSDTEKYINIKIEQSEDFVTIKITDYGKGIPQEDLDKIFEKYYSASKKFRKIGTGLGLYLSKQIVKAHNGEISVSSKENEGTEFCIKIPKHLNK